MMSNTGIDAAHRAQGTGQAPKKMETRTIIIPSSAVWRSIFGAGEGGNSSQAISRGLKRESRGNTDRQGETVTLFEKP